MTHPFYLVNVFALPDEPLTTGNPLAVFPHADTLSDDTMQAIARQFNLSETVFIKSSTTTLADLRIFTPSYELPLAGHPTLGAAWVLSYLGRAKDATFCLNTPAKPVGLDVQDNHAALTLTGYAQHPSTASLDTLCAITHLKKHAIKETAYWVDSGAKQLLLELTEKSALDHAQIDAQALATLCKTDTLCEKDTHEKSHTCLHLWYDDGVTIYARHFWLNHEGVLLEDSGTGSAAANVGAYLHSTDRTSLSRIIHQGDHMGRKNRLSLAIKDDIISIGGKVVLIGQGELFV